jgi:hypothetical protein
MKRISLILASLAVLFGGKASAFVGGPFDNGDFSSLLDNSGVYQVAFRFSNGSGFASFGNNVDTSLFLPTTGGTATSNTTATTFTVLSRSLFYYKGVTYLGSCTGMVDHERKIVSGITNGSTDITTTASTQTGGGGGATQTSTNNLITNNLSFQANSHFLCKITNSHPILKFSGDGEFTVLNPSIAQVSFQAIQQIITGSGGGNASIGTQLADLVNVLTGNSVVFQPDTSTPNPNDVIAVPGPSQEDIAGVIPSAQQVRDNSDRVKMKVFGSRIWHVSRR